MKNITHIMLAGPVTDGWTYQDNMITKYHKKLGYDVTIITSQWVWDNNGKLKKTEKRDYINEHGVHVIRLPLKGKDDFLKKWKRYVGVYGVLEKVNPDILFIHNVSFADVDTIVKYLRKHIIDRVYVDNHSDFSNSGTSWLSKNVLHKIIWKKNAQRLNPYTKKFYGVTPARVDWLVDMYGLPKSKCELLVMGGDDECIKTAQNSLMIDKMRRNYNISEDDFLIVTGGKIDEAKFQTIFLMEAVKDLNKPNVKLLVFGSVAESMKKRVDNLVDGEQIQYIGWIEAQDSYNYFAMADLVIFPGRHSVFWEQVAGMGIPMICKYWRGTTHIDVGGNVIFLNHDSKDEILGVLENIIENPQKYREMKRIAKQKGEKCFLYSSIAQKAIEVE